MSETNIVIDLTGPAMIFATLAGPIIAVWASEWRHSLRQTKEKRNQIFQTLMSTRATKINIVHVESLNQIDFAFSGSRYTSVRESWAIYRKHLQSPESASVGESQAVWQSKADDLFANLLHEIAKGLNMPFSKSYIIEKSYRPDAHILAEIDNLKLRRLLLEVLEKGRPLNIREISALEEHNKSNQSDA